MLATAIAFDQLNWSLSTDGQEEKGKKKKKERHINNAALEHTNRLTHSANNNNNNNSSIPTNGPFIRFNLALGVLYQ